MNAVVVVLGRVPAPICTISIALPETSLDEFKNSSIDAVASRLVAQYVSSHTIKQGYYDLSPSLQVRLVIACTIPRNLQTKVECTPSSQRIHPFSKTRIPPSGFLL